jgi:hypothetical protein
MANVLTVIAQLRAAEAKDDAPASTSDTIPALATGALPG